LGSGLVQSAKEAFNDFEEQSQILSGDANHPDWKELDEKNKQARIEEHKKQTANESD